MPAFIPPDYIDNSQQNKLDGILNRIITELGEEEAAFASGYFEPGVWELVGPALSQLKKFRLLLGREPQVELPANDLINLKKYYRQKLKGNLETLVFDRSHVRLVEELVAFLRREEVAVRLFQGQFLHAKAYIFPRMAIVGSSNFTPSGLRNNSELDLVSKSDTVADALLQKWYEQKWGQAADYKPDLIATLEESKFGSKPWTPYDVFIKVLYEYFRERMVSETEGGGSSSLDLAAFQQEGLQEAIRLLDLHRGVIVADAVGLGKTFIGLGLLEHYLIKERRRGNIPRGLVICPAQLKNTVWEPKLSEYQIAATVVSMEELGRQEFRARAYRNFDFVLVDESHNFRNPGTSRYRNLYTLLASGKRDKRVALLTATPINNTLWDLYHQLKLLTKGQEDYYRDWGISNLRGFFARVDKGGAELFNLLEESMVRRSRQDIRQRQQAGEKVVIAGKEIHFPDRRLASITYDLDGTYAGFYGEIAASVERLKLVSYNIEQFRVAGKNANPTLERNQALIGILKTLFLKRLESSVAAFEASVRWQQQFQQSFYNLLVKKNRLLDSASYRKLTNLLGGGEGGFEDGEADSEENGTRNDGTGGAIPASVEAVLAELPAAAAKDYDLAALKEALESDLAIFKALLDRLDAIRQGEETGTLRDDKLHQVKTILASPALKGRKVLIFSYYERTARYLYEALLADPTWQAQANQPRLALLTGRNNPAERKDIISRFAPRANADPTLNTEAAGLGITQGSRASSSQSRSRVNLSKGSDSLPASSRIEIDGEEPGAAEIDLLVSTDVLSEGQNLQDAGVLLNYDLHWNPVRMIQRAGRIDRVGSPHSELLIYNCFPEAELERLLGLVGRLQKRIADIGRNIGNDASILGELVTEKSLEEIKRLKVADRQVLQELEEEEAALLSADEMRLPLLSYLQELGESAVNEIPLGIHSGRGGQPIRGVFFAFRARDRHFWRFYEVEGGLIKGSALTDKRRLFRMLQCSRQEARVVPRHEVWSYLERATKDILAELRQQDGTRRFRQPLSGLNLRLYNTVATAESQPPIIPLSPTDDNSAGSESVTGRLKAVLQEIPLKPFERDPALREVLDTYSRTSNVQGLLDDLDTFAAEHELYDNLGTTTSGRSSLEGIKEQDLELICYELFS